MEISYTAKEGLERFLTHYRDIPLIDEALEQLQSFRGMEWVESHLQSRYACLGIVEASHNWESLRKDHDRRNFI